MAHYLTPAERSVQLNDAMTMMNNLVRIHSNIERIEKEWREAGYNTANIDTAISGLLVELEDAVDVFVLFFNTANNFISWENAIRAKPHPQHIPNYGYAYATIDVDNGSGRATITASNSAVAFSPYQANDIVEIVSCNDATNDGIYTVYSKTDSVLTLTTTMPGSDVATDYEVEVILRDRP